MSERRLLQIISDEARTSLGAPSAIVHSKYGHGYTETLYVLVRRGHVDKGTAGLLSLTKEGRAAIR